MAQTVERIKTEISPDLLDTIGKQFKFKHGKGIAELLKNSLDHYLRLHEQGQEVRGGNWPVLMNLIDGDKHHPGPKLALLDFGGTSLKNVQNFFLIWGDKSAATQGGVSKAQVTGGHGNGGKFYMREMWKDGARLTTWRNGKATSLVVKPDKDGTTGFWEHKDQAAGWREVLDGALSASEGLGGADPILQYMDHEDPSLVAELDANKRGFTVIVGRRADPAQAANVLSGNRWDYQKLVDEVHAAAQARRPIRELAISVFVNGQLKLERLTPDKIADDPNWPPEEVEIPASVLPDQSLAEGATMVGKLTIQKADAPLGGKQKDYNAVAVYDASSNPVATYPMREIPMSGWSSVINFIHAELTLTFPRIKDFVTNDRDRLVPSPTTDAILNWAAERIWERAKAVEDAQKSNKNKTELQKAAALNEALNRYAKSFLQELQTQIMVDVIKDDEGGGPGKSGEGSGSKGSSGGGSGPGSTGGNEGQGGSREVVGTTQPTQRPKFPQILLSGIDEDPANPGQPRKLTPQDPPIEQADIDKKYNVWWINTVHPFAEEAMARGGAKGNAFRSYQLFMVRDVVQHEALRYIQKRDRELDLDIVDGELLSISNNFLAMPVDLLTELLD